MKFIVVHVFNYDVVYVIITTITTQKSTIEINIVIVIVTVLDSLTVSTLFCLSPVFQILVDIMY